MSIDPTAPKSEIIEKAKQLAAKKNSYKYTLLALIVAGIGYFIYTGNKEAVTQLVNIGTEFALLEVKDGEIVNVVSATSPVSVTLVTATEVVSDTSINTFVDQQ